MSQFSWDILIRREAGFLRGIANRRHRGFSKWEVKHVLHNIGLVASIEGRCSLELKKFSYFFRTSIRFER